MSADARTIDVPDAIVPVDGSAGAVPFGFVVTVFPVDVVVVVGVFVFFGCVGVV